MLVALVLSSCTTCLPTAPKRTLQPTLTSLGTQAFRGRLETPPALDSLGLPSGVESRSN